jgi:spore germination protein YaaH/peptidoglycan/xylan/chitin deacetylase (PgdA/CDA1 family)
MKIIFIKFINVCLIITLLGAGIFYFSKYENIIRPWLPFYSKGNGLLPSDLPVNASGSSPRRDNPGNLAGIPVLLYHGVLEKIDPSDFSNITIKNFDSQMKMLKDEGYNSINIRDIDDFINNNYNLPEKPVVISFDDGRIDSVKNGDPILRKYGFKAVMFDVTGKQNSNDKFFLSWNDLLNMKNSGRWDIEVHGGDQYHTSIVIDQNGNTGHFASNKEWLSEKNRLETDQEYKQRLISDITKAKSDLMQHLPGIRLVSFAYPYGDYGEEATNIDKDFAIRNNHDVIDEIFPITFGFDGSYGDNFNFFYFKGTDPHLIKRLDVREALTADQLKGMLNIYINKHVPYNLNKFDGNSINNLLSVWGKSRFNNGSLQIFAASDSVGSQTIVTGTFYWLNYKFESDITIDSGQTGFLISRYKDNDNYLACGIDGTDISLRQIVGGHDTLIKSTPYTKILGKNFHISVEVVGNTASCSVDGETVGLYRIDSALYMGGIGFKSWDPEKGKSSMTVHNINATESKPFILGYANDLPVNGLMNLIKSDTQFLDIISPALHSFNRKGSIISKEWTVYGSKIKINNQTNLFPLISDWSPGMDAADQSVIHSILSDSNASNSAINNTVRLMTEKGYSGINLDIENLSSDYKDRYSDFIKNLAVKLHEHNLILIVSLSPRTGENDSSDAAGFDYESIGKYADLVVIMTYNKNNLKTESGPTAPCDWTESVAKYAAAKIEPDKIILGIPAYGYDWIIRNGRFEGYQSIPVNLSFNAGPLDNLKPVKETLDGSEYQYSDESGNIHSVWIENEKSLLCKTSQLNELKLSGLGLWSVGQEPPYFWKLLQDEKILR